MNLPQEVARSNCRSTGPPAAPTVVGANVGLAAVALGGGWFVVGEVVEIPVGIGGRVEVGSEPTAVVGVAVGVTVGVEVDTLVELVSSSGVRDEVVLFDEPELPEPEPLDPELPELEPALPLPEFPLSA